MDAEVKAGGVPQNAPEPELIKIEVRPEGSGRGAAAGVRDAVRGLTASQVQTLVEAFFRLREAAISTPAAAGQEFEFKIAASYSAELDGWVVKFNGEGSVELSCTCRGG